MNAAGRAEEFTEDYKAKLIARLDDSSSSGVIDILKHKPLPARSGKTIQMFQYESKKP